MPHLRSTRALVLLTCLAPLAATAQAPQGPATPPPPKVNAPPTPAELALDAAVVKLKAIPSVAATLSQSVEMLGQSFQVNGKYLKAPGNKTLTLMAVSGLGDASGAMQQVSDGQTFYDYQKIFAAERCQRLDLGPIYKRLDSPECDPGLREAVLGQLGYTGPETLLIGLRKALTFDQMSEGTFEGHDVLVLAGYWKDYDSLTGPGQPPFQATMPLPSYVPSKATVLIDKADGWPYKLVLEGRTPTILEAKKDDRPIGPDGKPIGMKAQPKTVGEKPTRIVMVYKDVKIGVTIDPREFAFQPGPQVSTVDGTEQLVAYLDKVIADSSAAKRAEAAKAGDAIPGGGLTAPAPGSAEVPPPGTYRSTAPPPK